MCTQALLLRQKGRLWFCWVCLVSEKSKWPTSCISYCQERRLSQSPVFPATYAVATVSWSLPFRSYFIPRKGLEKKHMTSRARSQIYWLTSFASSGCGVMRKGVTKGGEQQEKTNVALAAGQGVTLNLNTCSVYIFILCLWVWAIGLKCVNIESTNNFALCETAVYLRGAVNTPRGWTASQTRCG